MLDTSPAHRECGGEPGRPHPQQNVSNMQIIPVLDIKRGRVVRGVAGEREEYRPVESRIADDAEVLTVAEAFRAHFALTRLYVADLDAIQDDRPNFSAYRLLVHKGFEVIIDAGLRDVGRARELFDAGASAVIAGLESSPGPAHVAQLIGEFGPERVIFSLDLKHGRPLAETDAWGDSASEIARRTIELGVRRMIVLDLAGVGTASGVGTLELCRQLQEDDGDLELITGGGVRGVDDLRVLHAAGIDGVLVASALHNGSITMDDLNSLSAVE
jgi:phosphoribosylformimino-5-aminoimidazole carboxamide ribotide isomerase